jgi:hypothetical protein
MIWSPPSQTLNNNRPSSEAGKNQGTPLRTLERFCRIESEQDRPTVLDLGAPCNANIDFFGKRGFKIYVEDFLREYCDRGLDLTSMSHFLAYPASSFDGILCWDIFDFLKVEEASHMVQKISFLLKKEGAVSALFEARSGSRTGKILRHKITESALVIHEPLGQSRFSKHRYPNREIMKLFDGFEIVKSYYHKSGFQEYLFRKDNNRVCPSRSRI